MITTVIDDNSQLKVQFPSFRFFFVHLQSPARSFDSLLYEKVGILQNTIFANNELLLSTKEQLSETNLKLSSTMKELSDAKSELSRIRDDLSLMNETLHLIKPLVLCDSTDYSSLIASAHISGNIWVCHPGGTNAMVEPDGVSYCYIRAGNYVYFDLRKTLFIRIIRFRLWDGDTRSYTYSLDISTNRAHWTSLAAGIEGRSTEEYFLEENTKVRYLRMEGTNTANPNLILFSMSVDCVNTPV